MREGKSLVCTADAPNVQQVGGFSTMQLKLFLEEMELDPDASKKPVVTPWDTFRKAMDDECYLDIRKTIARVGEKVFQHYTAPRGEDDSSEDSTAEVVDDETKSESKHDASASGSDGQKSVSAKPSSQKTPLERLRSAKVMLDEGLIEQEEFDSIKAKVLSNM